MNENLETALECADLLFVPTGAYRFVRKELRKNLFFDSPTDRAVDVVYSYFIATTLEALKIMPYVIASTFL